MLVWAGIGLLLLGLSLGALVAGAVILASDDGSGPTARGRQVELDDLEPGHCFHDPHAETAQEGAAPWAVRVVPCTTYHDAEVIHTFDLEQRSWPGDRRLDSTAERRCDAAFADYVGEPYDDSPYESWWYTPGEETFEDGDRMVICMVSPPVGEIDHSARGHTFGDGEPHAPDEDRA